MPEQERQGDNPPGPPGPPAPAPQILGKQNFSFGGLIQEQVDNPLNIAIFLIEFLKLHNFTSLHSFVSESET
jgi:hypothetical protein